MITTVSVSNYRSLLDIVIPLSNLNVVTGANATGKSNLYKSLRLLAETAQGGVVNALAKEGGLDSTFWAGPEVLSKSMKTGAVPVQGSVRQGRKRLRLGFSGEQFGYAISLGLPVPSSSAFALDPEIKKECIWVGNCYRPANSLVERDAGVIKIRSGKKWHIVTQHAPNFESLFNQMVDPVEAPEIITLRDNIRNWRFYDHFRTDVNAPARQPQLGTRTPVLHHDGHDLAAALQTIREIGDPKALAEAINDAFPGAELDIQLREDGRFSVELKQHGLLRPLSALELSDGTLRYLLWVAALLTPRPPPLMVLNEPETSLHPDLLPALGKLIIKASQHTQVWVVSHAARLIASLNKAPECNAIELDKVLGETVISDQDLLDKPLWNWPDGKL